MRPLGRAQAGPCSPLALEQNAPNPFAGRTSIRFRIAAPGRADLGIHALDGRRVTTLVNAGLVAGGHAVTWNGRDDRGRPVPPSLCFSRLQAGVNAAVWWIIVMG
jgi:hypothetical protein